MFFKSKKPWFVPKSYGYGLMPVSWQGWLMTLVLVVLMAGSAYSRGFFDSALYVEPANLTLIYKQTVGFFIDTCLLIGVFLYFAEKKTKGEIKWNWGKK